METELSWWDERFALRAYSDPAVESRSLTATIDIEDEYVRDLVVDSFSRRQAWEAQVLRSEDEDVAPEASCSDLHWGEYERIDWERVHEGCQIVSMYCIRKGLIRKAHLAHNLKKWNAKHPKGRLSRAVPETLIMVLDDIDYFEEALSDVYEVRDMAPGSQAWIAKPSVTNQAIGVCIFDRVETLRHSLEQNPDLREWVLQRYIERPLLIRGRKFHLRAYVLCIGSLQCFVFSEMLALFAAKQYPVGNTDFADLDAHLTNTCRMGDLEGSGLQEDDVVKLASELPQELEREGIDVETAKTRIAVLHKDVIDIIGSGSAGSCMEAVSTELTFFTLPNCFELFGFDLMVDQDWNVWLLEANAEPDMKQTGQRLQRIIASLIEGVVHLVADPFAESRGFQSASTAPSPEGSLGGHWKKVFDKKQRNGVEPPSMRIH